MHILRLMDQGRAPPASESEAVSKTALGTGDVGAHTYHGHGCGFDSQHPLSQLPKMVCRITDMEPGKSGTVIGELLRHS